VPISSPSKTPSRQTIFGPTSCPELPLIALFSFAGPLLPALRATPCAHWKTLKTYTTPGDISNESESGIDRPWLQGALGDTMQTLSLRGWAQHPRPDTNHCLSGSKSSILRIPLTAASGCRNAESSARNLSCDELAGTCLAYCRPEQLSA
jgi:hypothetical protein